MFCLLLKARLLGAWNVVRFSSGRAKLVGAGFGVLGLFFFVAVFLAFYGLMGLAHGTRAREEMVFEIFYFLFLFLLAGAVPFVASTLLHSTDYLLLLAAPVRPTAIVAAKLLDAAIANSIQFTVIGVPAIAACGLALGLDAIWWPALIALTFLFVLLPALATSLVLMASLAAFGGHRVRGAIAAVNLAMAGLVCLTIVVQVNRLPIRHGMSAYVRGGPLAAPEVLQSSSPAARIGPSSWFARCLIDLTRGDIYHGVALFGAVIVGILALYAVCVMLGSRLLLSSTLGEDAGSEKTAAPAPTNARAEKSKTFRGPINAILGKDLRYVARDNVLLGQLGMPVILFFVPYALAIQQSMAPPVGTNDLYFVSLGMTGFIVFMQTSILSLSSIGLDGRAFWMLLCSPVPAGRVLVAKLAMSTIVSGGIGLSLAALNAIVYGVPLVPAIVHCLMIVLVAAALCGMGVGISGALPRFVYENPAHRVSAWALILGFFGTVCFLFVIGVVFAAGMFTAASLQQRSAMIYGITLALIAVLSIIASGVPIMIGARRLERYQWMH